LYKPKFVELRHFASCPSKERPRSTKSTKHLASGGEERLADRRPSWVRLGLRPTQPSGPFSPTADIHRDVAARWPNTNEPQVATLRLDLLCCVVLLTRLTCHALPRHSTPKALDADLWTLITLVAGPMDAGRSGHWSLDAGLWPDRSCIPDRPADHDPISAQTQFTNYELATRQ
jgi:hypothetical protein